MSNVLITGANRGIGLEMARAFAARGDTVIGTSRGPAPELQTLGARVETVDVTSAESVAALARALRPIKLDTLILNAGVLHGDQLNALDFAKIEQQIQVNSLGPLRVAAALRPNLKPGSKVAIITSRMGSIADNTSGAAYGYRMSKAAVNAAGRSLSIDLGRDGIPVVLLHPGYVRTGMTGGRGNWDPDEAAAALIARVDALSIETTGKFLHADGEELPW